jgi:neopullulanase
MRRLHTLLSQDFLYPNANHNLTFLDNHDMTRFFLSVGKDVNKFKMGLAFMLTTRGIPQLYYGTELLMDGDGGYHPNVRMDFPGGWRGDARSAFNAEGRTKEENDAFNYLKALLNWRKAEKVIHEGKLTHFIPEENIYVYFRHNDEKKIMVILNANDSEKTLDTSRFKEIIKSSSSARNIITNEVVPNLASIKLSAQSTQILELN